MPVARASRLGQALRGLAGVVGVNGTNFQAEFQTNGRKASRMIVSFLPTATSAAPLVARVVAYIGRAEDGASHVPRIPTIDPLTVPGMVVQDVVLSGATRASGTPGVYELPLDVPPGMADETITVEISAADDGGGGVAISCSVNVLSDDRDEIARTR